LDNLIPFSPMNKIGYLNYYQGCFYSVIEANEFAKYYNTPSANCKSSSKYLKNMIPVYSRINEFSNPIIMKITLK
jgi:hypothetical protein